ncbi:MAG: hypothetical protein AB9903_09490 [Vulcanimicrobiota bacterium]
MAISSTQNKKPWISIIDLKSASEIHSFPVGDGKSASLSEVAWGPDGTLFTWQNGGRSYLPMQQWSIKGKMLKVYSPYSEYKLSSDGRWAAFSSPGDPSKVKLVDLRNKSMARNWENAHLANLGFSRNAFYFYKNEMIVRVDLETLKETSWRDPGCIWVLPCDLLAAVGGEANEEGAERISMDFYDFGVQHPRRTLSTRPGIGSADGRWFANESGVWNLTNGMKLTAFSQKRDCRGEVAFSPDSRLLAYSDGYSILMIDLQNGKQRKLDTR